MHYHPACNHIFCSTCRLTNKINYALSAHNFPGHSLSFFFYLVRVYLCVWLRLTMCYTNTIVLVHFTNVGMPKKLWKKQCTAPAFVRSRSPQTSVTHWILVTNKCRSISYYNSNFFWTEQRCMRCWQVWQCTFQTHTLFYHPAQNSCFLFLLFCFLFHSNFFFANSIVLQLTEICYIRDWRLKTTKQSQQTDWPNEILFHTHFYSHEIEFVCATPLWYFEDHIIYGSAFWYGSSRSNPYLYTYVQIL